MQHDGIQLGKLLRMGIQRMTRDVHAEQFFLQLKLLRWRHRRDIRYLNLPIRFFNKAEKVKLQVIPLLAPFRSGCNRFIKDREMLSAMSAK
ncbi:hypothetical protein D3C86_1820950 [compost metagenome]